MHPKSLTPLLALLATLPASAAVRTWDGGDATANMTVAANWNGNTVINPAVDELDFPLGLALADPGDTHISQGCLRSWISVCWIFGFDELAG